MRASPAQSRIDFTAGVIFLCGILFYCYAYLLRIYPGVIQDHIISQFMITSSSFGLLTACYYLTYAPLQLPIGVFIDKVGTRLSLITACILCLIGATLFSSHSYPLAITGRLLIGLGCAFAYVSALKLASIWLPKNYFATATGIVTGAGMIAAITTYDTITHLAHTASYQHVLYLPIELGAVLLLLIYAFVKNPLKTTDKSQEESHALSYRALTDYLKMIVKNPQMWLIGCVGALLYLPASLFLDVYAIPYLINVDHFTPSQGALGVSFMLTGWVLSSLVTGAVSDVIGARRPILFFASLGATIISAVLVLNTHMSEHVVLVILFLFGLFCGPHPLCFTLSKENYPPSIAGTAIAFSNFLVMMGGLSQFIFGKILDAHWTGLSSKIGVRIYTGQNYSHAMIILPICLLVASILIFFIKETYKKN